jgi:eight-cysteine-cluster-containing protein
MTLRAALPLLLLGAVACANNTPEATPPPAPAPVAASSGGAPFPGAPAQGGGAKAAVDAAGLTPEALYESCRSRVEGRESPAECETDADCMSTGCSGEVCVTKEMAAGMATTCEMLKCFEVLDACGCVEGVCSWSLKDAVPAGKPLPVPLPKK